MSRISGIAFSTVIAVGLVLLVACESNKTPDVSDDAGFPSKDITLIVGFAPGGGTDVLARSVAKFMANHLEHEVAVIVKNIPGAGGQIGYTKTAYADADGYTLGIISLPGTLSRTIDRKTNYDLDSFTYLANFINDPNVIIASTASGILSIEMMLEEAKNAAGAMTVGLATLGGEDQFAIMALSELTGTNFNQIVFKGSAQVRTALMGGHIDVSVMNLSEVVGFKDELAILAVLAPERSETLPNVPTTREIGIDLQSSSRRGFVAPAGIPVEIKDRLIALLATVYEDPQLRRALAAQGSPTELVVGEDYEQLAKTQLEFAQKLWDVTPWRELE